MPPRGRLPCTCWGCSCPSLPGELLVRAAGGCLLPGRGKGLVPWAVVPGQWAGLGASGAKMSDPDPLDAGWEGCPGPGMVSLVADLGVMALCW